MQFEKFGESREVQEGEENHFLDFELNYKWYYLRITNYELRITNYL